MRSMQYIHTRSISSIFVCFAYCKLIEYTRDERQKLNETKAFQRCKKCLHAITDEWTFVINN